MNTHFSGFKYIQYLYSARLLRTNIFNIHIGSGCKEQIYSIYVFSKLFENDFIWYLYSVKSFYKYIFICIPWPTGSRNFSCLHKYETKLVKILLYRLLWKFSTFSASSLNSWWKRPIFSINSSFFGLIRTFSCKSRSFLDQFSEKSPDPDQSPEKTDEMEALILVFGEIFFYELRIYSYSYSVKNLIFVLHFSFLWYLVFN